MSSTPSPNSNDHMNEMNKQNEFKAGIKQLNTIYNSNTVQTVFREII